MRNIIKGNLLGYICDDCSENIANVKVRLYITEQTRNPKNDVKTDGESFKLLTTEQVEAKKDRLVGETTTNTLGNFEIPIKDDYKNFAFEFDFECTTVPGLLTSLKNQPVLQFHVDTFYPEWNHYDNHEVTTATHNATVPQKWWCTIKGRYYDVWTICGKLTHCETNSPMANVKVIAMDADFITDDELGSNVTDSNGNFIIYYNSAKFKKTFLSPIINIETDVTLPFASGPDVYFQLEYNGQRFAIETSANRRKNVPHCICVRLCTDELTPVDPSVPPSFTHFGKMQHIAIQSGINLGKTLSGYAFYSNVNMVGSIAKKINNNAMEYLFEYQEVGNPSDSLNPTPSSWLPVKPNMISKTRIGYLWTLSGDIMNPIAQEPYYINGGVTEKNATFNGDWIQVPQESNFVPHTDTEILYLNTETLTGLTQIDMSMPKTAIGTATVSASKPHTFNRYFAIRMRQRERLGDNTTINEQIAGTSKPIAIYNVVYNNVNQHGSWVPTTINGSRIAVSVDIQEIIAGASGCSKIVDQLHVRYGARNENLGSVQLSRVC